MDEFLHLVFFAQQNKRTFFLSVRQVQGLKEKYSHCVESFENLLQRYVDDEVWVAGIIKNTIFPQHPVSFDII